MAYLLNDIDILSTYGIYVGVIDNSNIGLSGWCDLPSRSGECFYDWGDENGIQPYVEEDDIMFNGRDLVLSGLILGSNFDLYFKLNKFYSAINAFTDLVVLSTPYGDFNVQILNIEEEHIFGACKLKISMREPIVDISGGEMPSVGEDNYSIDNIPMRNFGLYVENSKSPYDLPELKEQYFTKYGMEGFQIVFRKNNTMTINGNIMANNLSSFKQNILNLYFIFSSTGERTIKKNNETYINCFAKDGFSVTDIMIFDTIVIGKFSIELIVINNITADSGQYQTAVVRGGQIYISNDYGNTWTPKESSRNWVGISVSSTRQYQTAVVDGGQIYISNDYGNTWTSKESSRYWRGISVSSTGQYQTAVVYGGQIYISNDYGNTWTSKESSRYWRGISVSSTGQCQTAVVYGGQIYISNDYGNTWTPKGSSRNWYSIYINR